MDNADSSSSGSKPTCFICLSDEADGNGELPARSCKCPSLASHPLCRARWALHSAGKAEEKTCRFCVEPIGDWKKLLGGVATARASAGGADATATATATADNNSPNDDPISSLPAATMAVIVGDQVYKLQVSPGPEGKKAFLAAVRILLGLPATRPRGGNGGGNGGAEGGGGVLQLDDDESEDGGSDVEVQFDAYDPCTGAPLKLFGVGAFEAAAFCASLSAQKRGAAAALAAGEGEPLPPTSSPSSVPLMQPPAANIELGPSGPAHLPPPLMRSASELLPPPHAPAPTQPQQHHHHHQPWMSLLSPTPMPARPAAAGPRRGAGGGAAPPGRAVRRSSSPPQPPSSLAPPPPPPPSEASRSSGGSLFFGAAMSTPFFPLTPPLLRTHSAPPPGPASSSSSSSPEAAASSSSGETARGWRRLLSSVGGSKPKAA